MRKIRSFNKILAYFIILSVLTPKAFSVTLKDLGPIELSLKDVTSIALDNSLDIQIAKFDAYIERTELDRHESIFDTILEAEISYNKDKKAAASSLAAGETKTKTISFGLEKKTSTGTTIELDLSGTKTRTDSSVATLNPYHEALAEISITQELGKNIFGLADRSDIKITKLDIKNSEFTSLDSIADSLSEAQEAYWKFVLRTEQLLIKQDMLKEAQKLYKIYQDKLELGLVEESELLAIQALVKTRKSDVNLAIFNKESAKNNLLFLINRGDFEQEISSQDVLACQTRKADLYEALRQATENRRDYKAMKNELKRNDIDLVIKKNALWPEIDLEATYARNNIDSDRGNAWSDLDSKSNDQIGISLSFKVPLENREAKSALEEAKLKKQQYLLKFKRLERLILQEINDQVNQVNTSQNQVRLFEETVKIHQEKLDQQVKRLNSGRSNADTLISYEEDFLNARLSLAEHLYEYRISLIDLDLAKNALLDKYWKEPL